jgi:hypothetical protein
MIGWREKARAIRPRGETRSAGDGAAETRPKPGEAIRPEQAAFARRILKEVLIPVLTEFVGIVTDAPAEPACHEYDERSLGVSCDLDSLRFTIKVFLLHDSRVRVAVFLTPSQTGGHCKNYELAAPNGEIEEWVGSCLVKLYENR